MAADVSGVLAVGFNCSTPSDATAAVGTAARTGKPVVIYPNSGEGWDAVGSPLGCRATPSRTFRSSGGSLRAHGWSAVAVASRRPTSSAMAVQLDQ